MIVGEAPGEQEEARGIPFCGYSGMELDKMLHEAGIARSECFVTNVCPDRPPGNDISQWLCDTKRPKNPAWEYYNGLWVDKRILAGIAQLQKHIELVKPNVIIALGNLALHATALRWGVKSWRGSQLELQLGAHKAVVVPTYHPAAVLRDWSVRAIAVQDLRRAARHRHDPRIIVPNYSFIIRPNFGTAARWLGEIKVKLSQGPVKLSVDLETRAGHIACVGFATSKTEAISIPWMCIERPEGYWNPEEESVLWGQIREILTHPNALIFGQNFLYDAQYFHRFFFVKPKIWYDTMVAHHCMFPGQPKGLDYLASIYCAFYRYWKNDGKEWHPKMGEDKLWVYNCEDCVRTFEVMEGQWPALEADERLRKVWEFQQGVLVPRLFDTMLRGIRANLGARAQLKLEMLTEISEREKWIESAVGHKLNIRSPKQMQTFFYEDLRFKPIFNRKTKTVTLNDEALGQIAKREIAVRPLIRRIQELRSLGVFTSTFVEATLDRDQRYRCSFNPTGTDTFRLSSSENAFWTGTNFQNIPKGNEDPDPGDLRLPNVRKLFVPDEGQTMFDGDLDRADLQVVVWEAGDEQLRQALRDGIDLHLLNAGSVFQIKELNMEKLADPEFLSYAKKHYSKQRQFAKAWVHGTDYGGKDRTMAATVGITVAENERYRLRWFSEHPGIEAWHKRTEAQIKKFRWIENRFGYRYYFFDRIDDALPQALAWVPQSTVACVINRAWDNILNTVPGVEILIQVHDSLVGQFDTDKAEELLPRITKAAEIVVPYEIPLVIPFGIKTSTLSWGHVE